MLPFFSLNQRMMVKSRIFIWGFALFGVLFLAHSAYGQANQEKAWQALNQLNQIRQTHGLSAIIMDERLNEIAKTMAINAIETKQNPSIKRIKAKTLLKQFNFPYRRLSVMFQANNLAPDRFIKKISDGAKSQRVLLHPLMSHIGIYADDSAVKSTNGDGTLWGLIFVEPNFQADGDWHEKVTLFVNQFRAQHGLPPLAINQRLDKAARNFSRRMALDDFIAHKAPEGDRVGDRTRMSGYHYQQVMENLHGGSNTARGAVDAWIQSKKGHREAMLNKENKEMGIGYYYLPFDEGKARSVHYWTLIMANPAS